MHVRRPRVAGGTQPTRRIRLVIGGARSSRLIPEPPSRIVTTVYRPKRPPRKKKAAALDLPAIVRAAVLPNAAKRPPPQPASADRKPAIATSRKPRGRDYAPALSPEERQRRGDAAEELWRELVRRATGKGRP